MGLELTKHYTPNQHDTNCNLTSLDFFIGTNYIKCSIFKEDRLYVEGKSERDKEFYRMQPMWVKSIHKFGVFIKKLYVCRSIVQRFTVILILLVTFKTFHIWKNSMYVKASSYLVQSKSIFKLTSTSYPVHN